MGPWPEMPRCNARLADILAICGKRNHVSLITIRSGIICDNEFGISGELDHERLRIKAQLAFELTFRTTNCADTARFRGINIGEAKFNPIDPAAIAVRPIDRALRRRIDLNRYRFRTGR